MDEIWINYYVMPVCFGMNEFAIVNGLRFHEQLEPLLKETPNKKSKSSKTPEPPPSNKGKTLSKRPPTNKGNKKIEELLDIARRGYKGWAFEVIPHLRIQVKNSPDEISHPRIFRWLAAKSNIKIKEVDLFNPSNDAVVHPSFVPTEKELGMNSFITLGLIHTIADPMVELIKEKLDGAIAIRRAVRQGRPHIETLHDQPAATDLGVACGGIASGVVEVSDSHADTEDAASHNDEHVDAQEKDQLFEKIDALTNVVEKLKSKRGVIPSKKVREPYTPTVEVRKKKRAIRHILSNKKSKQIATPPLPKVDEVQGPLKKVYIYT
ncbi:hypothetical protein FXO37_17652 [Capsicum annuum]|nr:hypothetical protein FXO37_17652 [Capsicum annuum]